MTNHTMKKQIFHQDKTVFEKSVNIFIYFFKTSTYRTRITFLFKIVAKNRLIPLSIRYAK